MPSAGQQNIGIFHIFYVDVFLICGEINDKAALLLQFSLQAQQFG
jgi:hypothetical protein